MQALPLHTVDTVLGPLAVYYKKREKSKGDKKARKDRNCVIFWPSLFCDSTMYDGLVAQLQCDPNTSLILVDGPGHGASPNQVGKFTMEECGLASKEILDHFKEKSCHYIGTSWGGLAAAWLAVSEPERVKSLTLLNVPFAPYGGLHRMKLVAITSLHKLFGPRSKFMAIQTAKSLLGSGSQSADPSLAPSLAARMLQHDGTGIGESVSSVLLAREDCVGLLAQIEQPTLLMSGSDDAFSPPDEMRLYSSGMKNHTFVELPGIGHLMALEAPQATAAEINRFWQQL